MNNFSIPVYSSWISDEDVEAVRRVAAEGWISSTGPEVQKFENDSKDGRVREATAGSGANASVAGSASAETSTESFLREPQAKQFAKNTFGLAPLRSRL